MSHVAVVNINTFSGVLLFFCCLWPCVLLAKPLVTSLVCLQIGPNKTRLSQKSRDDIPQDWIQQLQEQAELEWTSFYAPLSWKGKVPWQTLSFVTWSHTPSRAMMGLRMNQWAWQLSYPGNSHHWHCILELNQRSSKSQSIMLLRHKVNPTYCNCSAYMQVLMRNIIECACCSLLFNQNVSWSHVFCRQVQMDWCQS